MQRGIIIVDHGSRRAQSNQMLEVVAEKFAGKYESDGFDIVEPAHMELAMPDIAAAYGKCVKRGAEEIVILPYFLAEGKHWTKDIPSLTSQASRDFPGTRYTIAPPLGLDDLILQLLHKRAVENEQPVIEAGGEDPRLAGVEPSQRRVQCNTCPFRVTAAGEIQVRDDAGITLEQLAARA
ncbi:MAG: CbiX/SirB N-terminal domain-containing protein [Planctomycetota bacterium]